MTNRRQVLRAAGLMALAAPYAGIVQAIEDAAPLRFGELYVGATFQEGIGAGPVLKLSAKALALSGRRVTMVGFMDGILPRDGMYFMLIKEPSFLCPFHTVSFDWAGFVPIFVARPVEYVDGPVRVTGRFEAGGKTDEMGLVSHVRIYDAQLTRVR